MQHDTADPHAAASSTDDEHRSRAYSAAHVAVELAMGEFMPEGMTPALGRCFDVAEALLDNARSAAAALDWDGARSSLRMLATLLDERVKRAGWLGDDRKRSIRRAAIHTLEVAVCSMHSGVTPNMVGQYAGEAVRSCDSVARLASMPASYFHTSAEA